MLAKIGSVSRIEYSVYEIEIFKIIANGFAKAEEKKLERDRKHGKRSKH